jgi:hypothetical protein
MLSFGAPQQIIRQPFPFWGGNMVNEFYRAERCRDLADEYRRIALMCASTEMRNHYSRMSEHYRKLAEAEGLAVEAS